LRRQRNGLDPAIARRRPTFGVAGSFEVVDHGGDVGGIAVHGQRQLAHGPGFVRVNREQGAQAGLRDAELCCDLGPAPTLVEDQLHQQSPRQP